MAPLLHKVHRPIIICVFETNLIGHQLVVEAGLRERLQGRHVLVEHVPEALDGGGYDAGAASGAGDEVEGSVCVFDYCGRDGGEGAFARANIV